MSASVVWSDSASITRTTALTKFASGTFGPDPGGTFGGAARTYFSALLPSGYDNLQLVVTASPDVWVHTVAMVLTADPLATFGGPVAQEQTTARGYTPATFSTQQSDGSQIQVQCANQTSGFGIAGVSLAWEMWGVPLGADSDNLYPIMTVPAGDYVTATQNAALLFTGCGRGGASGLDHSAVISFPDATTTTITSVPHTGEPSIWTLVGNVTFRGSASSLPLIRQDFRINQGGTIYSKSPTGFGADATRQIEPELNKFAAMLVVWTPTVAQITIFGALSPNYVGNSTPPTSVAASLVTNIFNVADTIDWSAPTLPATSATKVRPLWGEGEMTAYYASDGTLPVWESTNSNWQTVISAKTSDVRGLGQAMASLGYWNPDLIAMSLPAPFSITNVTNTSGGVGTGYARLLLYEESFTGGLRASAQVIG